MSGHRLRYTLSGESNQLGSWYSLTGTDHRLARYGSVVKWVLTQ